VTDQLHAPVTLPQGVTQEGICSPAESRIWVVQPVTNLSTALPIVYIFNYDLLLSSGTFWRPATGWTVEGSVFESRWCQEFSLLHVVHTGSGAHPASYKMGTGASFPEVKRPGREPDHLQLVPSSENVALYIHSPYVFMA
jgi:hypothetical protein